MLTIGCIACRREGGDGSAHRGQSVIFDCLAEVVALIRYFSKDWHKILQIYKNKLIAICIEFSK